MKSIFLLILLFAVFMSCQDIERTAKPDNLIPEDKMVDVLTELSLLHGARSYNKSLMEEKGINPYPYLMEKFNIDSTQLIRSNNYYSENYKQYQTIYDKVKIKLEILMEEYDSLREIEEIRQDSIRIPDSLKPEVDSILQETILYDLPLPISRTSERALLLDTVR